MPRSSGNTRGPGEADPAVVTPRALKSHRHRRRSVGWPSRWLRRALLVAAGTLAAVFIGTALLAPAAAAIGYTQILITGNSMHPAIFAGDLVYVSPAKQLRPGDIATFRVSNGTLVTHRVVEVVRAGESAHDAHLGVYTGPALTGFVVKGDANQAADPYYYAADNMVGRVEHVIPNAGFALYYLAKYRVAVLLTVAALAIAAHLLNARHPTRGESLVK